MSGEEAEFPAKDKLITTEDSVSYVPWVKRGIMMVSTYALEIDDPDHVYNQIVAQGKDPEDFGVENPVLAEFKNWSREKLIKEVYDLRNEVRSLLRMI